MQTKRWVAALLAAPVLACGSPAPLPAPTPAAKAVLTMAVMPPVTSAAAQPVAAEIAARLKVRVEVTAPGSYQELKSRVAGGTVDLAWIDALAYVAVGARAGDLVVRSPSVPALVICNALAAVPALRDGGDWSALRGKSFAFGEPGSLPGNLWPKYYMKLNGIDPARDVVAAKGLATPAAISLSVYNNTAACGAIASDSRGLVTRIAPDIVTKTQVAFTAPEPVPGSPLLLRHQLNPGQRDRLRQLFASTPALGLEAASDRDYDVLRRVVAGVDPGAAARAAG